MMPASKSVILALLVIWVSISLALAYKLAYKLKYSNLQKKKWN